MGFGGLSVEWDSLQVYIGGQYVIFQDYLSFSGITHGVHGYVSERLQTVGIGRDLYPGLLQLTIPVNAEDASLQDTLQGAVVQMRLHVNNHKGINGLRGILCRRSDKCRAYTEKLLAENFPIHR